MSFRTVSDCTPSSEQEQHQLYLQKGAPLQTDVPLTEQQPHTFTGKLPQTGSVLKKSPRFSSFTQKVQCENTGIKSVNGLSFDPLCVDCDCISAALQRTDLTHSFKDCQFGAASYNFNHWKCFHQKGDFFFIQLEDYNQSTGFCEPRPSVNLKY